MSTVDALIDDARRLVHSPDWNHARLARATGLRCYDIIGIDRPDWNPTAVTLRALERLLVRRRKSLLRVSRSDVPEARADSFESLADRYITWCRREGRRCADQEQHLLTWHVLPSWTGLRMQDLSERHVVRLIDELQGRLSPSYVARVLRVASNVCRLAVRRGLIASNPCRDFRPPSPRTIRNRILHPEEIVGLWRGLETASTCVQARQALLCQLVTVQRITAVRQAEAAEIDMTWPCWSIPSERMKTGNLHMVPLSTTALAVLEGVRAAGTGRYLFPSARFDGRRPITKSAIQGTMRQISSAMGERVTSHDLRRTAATAMIRLGITRTVVQKVLGHRDPAVIAAYDRHDYEDEKRLALESWGQYLTELVGPDAVRRAAGGWRL